MEIDIIFIVLIIILAVAILFAVSMCRHWLFPAMKFAVSGSGEPDPVCGEVNDCIDTFLNGRFTPELANKMEDLIGDIAYDVADLDEKKIRTMADSALNTAAAKLLLDSMLHYYIYDKLPNDVSRDAITENIKKLNVLSKEDLCFTPQKISSIIKYLEESLRAGRADEKKITQVSPRECFRTVQILMHTNKANERKKLSEEVDRLKDELSKKNIELRQKSDELDRERGRRLSNTNTGSLTTELLLEDCNRERRQLQEKIYELRRDIERVSGTSSAGASGSELKTLRDRIEDLRSRNIQLENQLRDAEKGSAGEMNEIISLTTELNNCRKLLDEVLNAQT